MKGWPFRLLLGGAIVAVVTLVAVAALGPDSLRWGVGAAGRAAGYGITYDRIERRDGHLSIVRPDVTGVAGAPLFTAQSVDVAFSLRDVLGSPYLYGIHSIEIDRPKLTIVRYKDGTFNFTLPANNGRNNNKPFAIPKIRLAIKDGSIGIIDETRIFEHSRRIAIEDVQLAADVDPRRRSHAVAGFALLEEGGKFPFSAVSTFDEERGYESSRLTAKTLAVAPLLDFALNSTTLHVAGGVLNAIDARFYGFRDKSGDMQRHLSAAANLDHFQPYLAGLAKPLRDGRGSVRVYDDGLTIPKADGSIANVPVRIAGAIFNLSKPQLRLGIAGRGELRDLITISDAAKKLPILRPDCVRTFSPRRGDAADDARALLVAGGDLPGDTARCAQRIRCAARYLDDDLARRHELRRHRRYGARQRGRAKAHGYRSRCRLRCAGATHPVPRAEPRCDDDRGHGRRGGHRRETQRGRRFRRHERDAAPRRHLGSRRSRRGDDRADYSGRTGWPRAVRARRARPAAFLRWRRLRRAESFPRDDPR